MVACYLCACPDIAATNLPLRADKDRPVFLALTPYSKFATF